MWEMLYALVTSKKFMTTVGAVVAVLCAKIAGKFGVVIDPSIADELTKVICVMAAVYVGAQGIADHGKEAIKIAVEAGAQTVLKDITAAPQAPAAPVITPPSNS